jgi:RNA polymerase sigma factor (TIGR02999 family)
MDSSASRIEPPRVALTLSSGSPSVRTRLIPAAWMDVVEVVTASASNVTELLQAWSAGDVRARDQLLPLIYDDLRRQAAGYLRHERPGHTLPPTALVHEAYLRLADQRRMAWQNRAHFLALAAQAMRRILIDHARAAGAAKRAGDWARVSLNDELASPQPDIDLRALDDAINELGVLDPQQARIVELRFFGGMSVEETAEVLGISSATIKRDWSSAKAWLYRRLYAE